MYWRMTSVEMETDKECPLRPVRQPVWFLYGLSGVRHEHKPWYQHPHMSFSPCTAAALVFLLHCHLWSTTAAALTQTPCGEAASLPWTYSNKWKPGAVGSCCLSGLKRVGPSCSVDLFFLSAIFDTKLVLFRDLEVSKIMLYSEKDCKIPIIFQIKTNWHQQEQKKILLYTTTSKISFKLSKAVNNSPISRITPAEKILQISLLCLCYAYVY